MPTSHTHDLFYLEDKKETREAFMRLLALEAGALRVSTGVNLADLQRYLEDKKARSYLIDGNFPKKEGEEPELLFVDAIKVIRELQPEARLAVLSLERKSILEDLIKSTIRNSKGIELFDKSGDYDSLFAWIKE